MLHESPQEVAHSTEGAEKAAEETPEKNRDDQRSGQKENGRRKR